MLGAVACGEPIYMDEVRGEYYPMDSSIHADFCLRAQGDSMTGARIYDGDIVCISNFYVLRKRRGGENINHTTLFSVLPVIFV